jgi:uncharacterized protein YjiS (DUF1127 family)
MSDSIKPEARQGGGTINKAPGMTFILRWWKQAVRGWERRRMIAALKRLGDLTLIDIGIQPGNIEDFVDSLSDAELKMAPIAPEPPTRTRGTSGADLRKAA